MTSANRSPVGTTAAVAEAPATGPLPDPQGGRGTGSSSAPPIRVAILGAGRIEQFGTPADVTANPQSAFVRDFLA